MIWARVNLTVLWANTQSWHKNSVTDPLECSLKQTVCPKHEENAQKNEKNRGFFGKFSKKIFRIGGWNYSILEVIYLIKISVRSKSIPYWRFIPFWSIPYWSSYCTIFVGRIFLSLSLSTIVIVAIYRVCNYRHGKNIFSNFRKCFIFNWKSIYIVLILY